MVFKPNKSFGLVICSFSLFPIAAFVCALVIMTSFSTSIRRVAVDGFDDAGVVITLGGSVAYRLCHPSVNYRCTCCDCSSDSDTARSGTLTLSRNNSSSHAHGKSGSDARASGPTAAAAAATVSDLRVAMFQEATTTSAALGKRQHPDNICQCGVASYDFSDCTVDESYFNECPRLKERLSRLGEALLVSGVISCVVFGTMFVGWLTFLRSMESRAARALFYIVFIGLFATDLAFAIIALKLLYQDTLNCTDCCDKATAPTLAQAGFTQDAAPRNSTVALSVFCGLSFLVFVAAAIMDTTIWSRMTPRSWGDGGGDSGIGNSDAGQQMMDSNNNNANNSDKNDGASHHHNPLEISFHNL